MHIRFRRPVTGKQPPTLPRPPSLPIPPGRSSRFRCGALIRAPAATVMRASSISLCRSPNPGSGKSKSPCENSRVPPLTAPLRPRRIRPLRRALTRRRHGFRAHRELQVWQDPAAHFARPGARWPRQVRVVEHPHGLRGGASCLHARRGRLAGAKSGSAMDYEVRCGWIPHHAEGRRLDVGVGTPELRRRGAADARLRQAGDEGRGPAAHLPVGCHDSGVVGQ